MENARRGCELHEALEEQSTAAVDAKPNRPGLVRVNSVPILTTPESRIRRNNTPSSQEPSPAQPSDPCEMPGSGRPDPVPVPVPEGVDEQPPDAKAGVNTTKKSRKERRQEKKNKKKEEKKERKRQKAEGQKIQSNPPQEVTEATEPDAGDTPQEAAQDSQPLTTGQAQASTAGPAHGADLALALRPAAKKAKAKPSVRPTPVVKKPATPARTDEMDELEREYAEANALRRARTVSQVGTPLTSERDIEELLDAEIKQELQQDEDKEHDSTNNTGSLTVQALSQGRPQAPQAQQAAPAQPAPQAQQAAPMANTSVSPPTQQQQQAEPTAQQPQEDGKKRKRRPLQRKLPTLATCDSQDPSNESCLSLGMFVFPRS